MTWILKQVARLLWSASSCSRKQHILDAWGRKMWENNEQESIYLPPKCMFFPFLQLYSEPVIPGPNVVRTTCCGSAQFSQQFSLLSDGWKKWIHSSRIIRPRSCWMNFLWLAICQISQWHLKLICGNRSTEGELNVGRVIITHLPVSHALIWDDNWSYYQSTKHFSSVVGLK